MTVWIATTLFRNEPRWSEDGFASFGTYIDGVGVTSDIAKAFALMCDYVPVRWFRTKRGWLGMHKPMGTERHFHEVEACEVKETTGEWGWPA